MVSAKLPQISSKIFGIKKFIEAHENPIYVRVWDELTIKYSLKIFSLFHRPVIRQFNIWIEVSLSIIFFSFSKQKSNANL